MASKDDTSVVTDGADGASAAAAVDPLVAPKSVPAPKEEYTTYADDAALGKPAPAVDTLEYVKGDPVTLGGGKVTVVLFWAKFAKGDYTTIAGVSKLASMYAGVPDVQFVGLSVDPEKGDAESFLKKIGTSMPEIYITDLQVPYPLAWDSGKKVKEAFRKLSGLMSLGVSATFIIDRDGSVVWREQFGQGYFPPDKGQLAEQLRRVVLKEELLSNGPKPKADDEDDEDEEETMEVPDGDDDDDDLGLGW